MTQGLTLYHARACDRKNKMKVASSEGIAKFMVKQLKEENARVSPHNGAIPYLAQGHHGSPQPVDGWVIWSRVAGHAWVAPSIHLDDLTKMSPCHHPAIRHLQIPNPHLLFVHPGGPEGN